MKLPTLKPDEAYARIELARAGSVFPKYESFSEGAMRFCVKNWRKTLQTIMRDKKGKIIGRIVNVTYTPAEKVLHATAIVKKDKVKNFNSETITFVDKS